MSRYKQLRSSSIQLALFVATTFASVAAAWAHPHVWVTVETEVVYDEHKAITGFRHKWTFDEGYSQFAVEGRDLNNDGQYDRAELQELAEVNVSTLKEFEFFTFPKVSNKLIDRDPPKDYWLEYKDGLLSLFLTLPLKTPVPAARVKDFTFAVTIPRCMSILPSPRTIPFASARPRHAACQSSKTPTRKPSNAVIRRSVAPPAMMLPRQAASPNNTQNLSA